MQFCLNQSLTLDWQYLPIDLKPYLMKLKNELYYCLVRWVATDQVPEQIMLMRLPTSAQISMTASLYFFPKFSFFQFMLVWESIDRYQNTDEKLNLLDEDETQPGNDDIGPIKTIEAIEPWNSTWLYVYTCCWE